MKKTKIKVGIIGCGNIANTYASQIQSYPHVKIVGFQDVLRERAEKLAAQCQAKTYDTIADLLADPAIDLVVNLTIHHAHAAVITQCLEAGKHVHTEKPLALNYEEARKLVELAERKGLRLSSAPITYMGSSQETAWRLVREGRAGKVRLIYAEVNHGRIEAWHPNPEPFYDVGILWDVAVYPLTLLTAFFGPARKVTGIRKLLYPHRVTKEGRPFSITTPDFCLALIEFDDGVVARLTANFYTGSYQGGSVEIHGDGGRIWLESFQNFGGQLKAADYGKPYEDVKLVRPQETGIEFGRGVDEMARAMLEGRPQRATGAHAAHVCEIIVAIERSASEGKPVDITSSFPPPQPIDFAALSPFTPKVQKIKIPRKTVRRVAKSSSSRTGRKLSKRR